MKHNVACLPAPIQLLDERLVGRDVLHLDRDVGQLPGEQAINIGPRIGQAIGVALGGFEGHRDRRGIDHFFLLGGWSAGQARITYYECMRARKQLDLVAIADRNKVRPRLFPVNLQRFQVDGNPKHGDLVRRPGLIKGAVGHDAGTAREQKNRKQGKSGLM